MNELNKRIKKLPIDIRKLLFMHVLVRWRKSDNQNLDIVQKNVPMRLFMIMKVPLRFWQRHHLEYYIDYDRMQVCEDCFILVSIPHCNIEPFREALAMHANVADTIRFGEHKNYCVMANVTNRIQMNTIFRNNFFDHRCASSLCVKFDVDVKKIIESLNYVRGHVDILIKQNTTRVRFGNKKIRFENPCRVRPPGFSGFPAFGTVRHKMVVTNVNRFINDAAVVQRMTIDRFGLDIVSDDVPYCDTHCPQIFLDILKYATHYGAAKFIITETVVLFRVDISDDMICSAHMVLRN